MKNFHVKKRSFSTRQDPKNDTDNVAHTSLIFQKYSITVLILLTLDGSRNVALCHFQAKYPNIDKLQ